MPTPDFTNTTLFPTYAAIPETTTPDNDSQQEEDWFLLAQIKDDMTIVKPTLVLSDRAGAPFALIFDGLARDALDFKALGLKKGCTAVVPRARRTPPREEGKRGFVSVPRGKAGEVRAIPAGLERVLEVGGRMRAGEGEGCEVCGKEGDGGLKRCEGCRGVRYCGKVSFFSWICFFGGWDGMLMMGRNVRSRDGVRGGIRGSARSSKRSRGFGGRSESFSQAGKVRSIKKAFSDK